MKFIGDCRSILDNEWDHLDATDMSNLVAKGQQITKDQFGILVPSGSDIDGSYWHCEEHRVVWIYNPDEDVHYFFN